MAYPAIAAAMALVSLPACIYALSAARGRLPGKGAAPATGGAKPADQPGGLALGQAIRTPAFWQLVIGSLLAGWGIMSLQVFIAPMLQEKQIDSGTVAMLAGLLGVAATVGRLVSGVLLDRFPAKIIGTISMLLPAGACLLYLYVPIDLAVAAAIAVLFGVAIGAEGDVMAYLASRHFGLRNFGTIFGFMAGAVALGAGAGPFTIALVRDFAGNYQTVAMTLMVAMLATALLIGTLGKYPETISHPA
jgi:predicted MFS family arabinose efflux permease